MRAFDDLFDERGGRLCIAPVHTAWLSCSLQLTHRAYRVDLASLTEADLLKLHGVAPNAIETLFAALAGTTLTTGRMSNDIEKPVFYQKTGFYT